MSEVDWRSIGRMATKVRGRALLLLAGLLMATALSGCGCRPGYVGPYGGIHPGRCWVG